MRGAVEYGARGKREEWGGDKMGVKVPAYTAARRATVSVEKES